MMRILALACAAALLLGVPASSQQPRTTTRSMSPTPQAGPRLIPVAETKLLMEGMTNTNLIGLEKLVRSGDLDAESWSFARGQALLIAESGNLLLLRPPKNAGEATWMKYAAELRDSAGQLAKTIAAHDLERTRSGVIALSGTCNRCHEAFRVPTRIKVFAAEKP